MPGTFSYTVATNVVAVTGGTSGSPADFASFVAADRGDTALISGGVAGANLKAAATAAAGMVLTYPVRPVELLSVYLTFTTAQNGGAAVSGDESIDIYGVDHRWTTFSASEAAGQTVLSVTNASQFKIGDTVRLIDISAPATTETGTITGISLAVGANTLTLGVGIANAYIAGDIIGVDCQETITTSAAHGAYVSANKYGQIAYWDCNGYDGVNTCKVDQPIWGVIWNKGNGQYQLDCKVEIGNGSTATYFVDTTAKSIHISAVITANWQMLIYVRNNANFIVGVVVSSTLKTTKNGCFITSDQGGTYTRHYLVYGDTQSNIGLYSCGISNKRASGDYAYLYGVLTSGYYRVWNCLLDNVTIQLTSYGDINNLILSNSGISFNSNMSLVNNAIINVCTQLFYAAYSCKIRDTKIYGTITRLGTMAAASDISVHLINCYLDTTTILWSATNGSIYRQLTIDIEVQDELGNAISGAACTLTDVAAGVVWNAEVTNANGNIAATGEDGSGETNSISYKRYYYSGSAQTTTYGPWTLTVSKAGYKTETVFIGTDEAELWEANLGGKIPVTLSRAGIPPYFTEYAND